MAPSWPSWPSGPVPGLEWRPELQEQREPQTSQEQRQELPRRHTRFSLLYGRGTHRSWLHPSNKNHRYRVR